MPAYPWSLPAPSVQGYGVAPIDKTVRTDMDVGAPRVRLRSRARLDMVTATWRFKNDEMAAFRAWFESASGYNLLSSPEDFSAANWSKSSATVTANTAVAPDGATTADKCITTAVSSGGVFQNLTVTPLTNYVLSFYAEATGTETNAGYRVYNNTGAANIVGSTSYFSQINTTSFKRIVVPYTTPAGCVSVRNYVSSDIGGVNNGAHVWGALVHLGSSALPYLPTNAGVVDGVNFGASFFTISLPLGNNGFETRSARFVGGYKATPVGRMAWDVSAQLEVR